MKSKVALVGCLVFPLVLIGCGNDDDSKQGALPLVFETDSTQDESAQNGNVTSDIQTPDTVVSTVIDEGADSESAKYLQQITDDTSDVIHNGKAVNFALLTPAHRVEYYTHVAKMAANGKVSYEDTQRLLRGGSDY